MAQRRYTVFLILLMLDPRYYIQVAEMSESDLKAKFSEYCEFGKDTISVKNLTRMFTDCDLFNAKFSLNQLEILFAKVKGKGSREINFQDFEALLGNIKLNDAYDYHSDIIRAKIAGCVRPWYSSKNLRREHWDRIDESGNGRGFGGREDVADNSGYGGGYQGAGTYDPKH
ncbi:tubulin polymerization-promoting protein family member 2 [Lingula anatina]|uniref:Tubulin polymerization-promoting protein family member 2 n=1 Tax=Lingula anatina TaxID=7574 RepID=A0A1S3IXW6_LINAN|nr:tubulin polymerization-promoting protein family member 2 [Lingula anatina]|eukprot:XP_013402873.1 tubulin polymerization-promoting protein family member 2 [Lingula anatina]